MAAVEGLGHTPRRGIGTAFEKTCSLHDRIRGELGKLVADDSRLVSQNLGGDRAALTVLRDLLFQLEDRLQKCRLAEASGTPPDVDLMKSLDKTRKELATACQQSLLVVTSCKALVVDVLQFCDMTGETATVDPAGYPPQRPQQQPPPQDLDPSCSMMQTPPAKLRGVGVLASGAPPNAMSSEISADSTWARMDGSDLTSAAARKLQQSAQSAAATAAADRQFADVDGLPGSRRTDQGQPLPSHPQRSAGYGADGEAGALHDSQDDQGPGQPLPMRLSLDLTHTHGSMRAREGFGAAGPHDLLRGSSPAVAGSQLLQQGSSWEVAGLSRSSGAEQWALTAAHSTPSHMRVVRDPVHVRPRKLQDNSVSYTLSHNGNPAKRWLGRLGRWVGSGLLAAAMVVGVGIASAWAVEEVGVRIMNSRDTCITEDALEPGLPQLRSRQHSQQQQPRRKHKKRSNDDQDGRLKMLLPVFPAPDASVGRG